MYAGTRAQSRWGVDTVTEQVRTEGKEKFTRGDALQRMDAEDMEPRKCDGKCNALKNGWVSYCGEGIFTCEKFDNDSWKCEVA